MAVMLQCMGDKCPKDEGFVDYRCCTGDGRRSGLVSFGKGQGKHCEFFGGDDDSFLYMPCQHPHAVVSNSEHRKMVFDALTGGYR